MKKNKAIKNIGKPLAILVVLTMLSLLFVPAVYAENEEVIVEETAESSTDVSLAGDWVKYEPCSELVIGIDDIGKSVIVTKGTGRNPDVVWSMDALGEAGQKAVKDSLKGVPGSGNPKNYEFISGDGASAYGMTVSSTDGKIFFEAEHFSDYAITGDLEGNVSYEYYLVKAPTITENGLYNQRTYYINSSEEKVIVEARVFEQDQSIDFAGWYLRTMVQYKTDGDNMDVRFISMLNGECFNSNSEKLVDYDYAGFNITIDGDAIAPIITNVANTSFLANGKEILIKDYSDNKDCASDYFFLANTMIASNIVNNDSVITVVPFVKLMDGTTVEGKTVTFTIGQLTGN